MAILVDQRFPKCAYCGKMLPLPYNRSDKRTILTLKRDISFCGEHCKSSYYKKVSPAGSKDKPN